MFSRALFLLLPLAVATGCAANGIAPTAESGPGSQPSLALEGTKKIMTKQAPDALIAPDMSTCRVAPDVFSNAAVGSYFRCRWVRN
jgi:hypothetical protein